MSKAAPAAACRTCACSQCNPDVHPYPNTAQVCVSSPHGRATPPVRSFSQRHSTSALLDAKATLSLSLSAVIADSVVMADDAALSSDSRVRSRARLAAAATRSFLSSIARPIEMEPRRAVIDALEVLRFSCRFLALTDTSRAAAKPPSLDVADEGDAAAGDIDGELKAVLKEVSKASQLM
eukprot:COSAG01_NODE_9028_length_2578_cov_1.762001_1_plen_179_part_10